MVFLEQMLTPFLVLAAVAYAVLAAYISRSGPQHANGSISMFLLLISGMLVGSAFSYGATDASMYGLGRIFSFTSAGFVPLVFYSIYRDYTVGPAPAWLMALLAVVPVTTFGLVLTNSHHEMIYSVVETQAGLITSATGDHAWYARVYAPFTYGFFAWSALALLGRLPTIAPAHRKTILILLICAVLPFSISVANAFFGFGPVDYPMMSLVLGLLWPFFTYAGISIRVHEFSPIAYQTLFDHVRDPIFVIDNEQCIICANRAAQQLLNEKESNLLGRKLWQDFPAARAILESAKELDMTQTLRMDTSKVYEVSVGPLSGQRGQNIGMVVVCRDVTERRKALGKLADSEHLIRTLIETSSNGFLRFARDTDDDDQRFRCVFANRSAESFMGESQGALVGMLLDEMPHLNPEKLTKHFSTDSEDLTQVSFEAAAKNGQDQSWLRIIGEPVGDDFSVTLIDITQRKRNEDKMMADALRDPLTGVLNRRGFEREGAACIRNNSIGAVLYLDLNQFKSINDRFGHQAGDALLKAFGHRLEFCLRPEDILGRLGGDEFAIVLPGVDVDDVRHVATRLVQTASEAYIIQGEEIKCTASVGIALLPRHGEELWHLLSVADEAMYAAKRIPDDEAANDRAAYVEAATAT